MKLNISDIQHFSLGDGDGIRTTVFFKGCNLHCPWCHNPETISPKTQVLHFPNELCEKVCGKEMTIDEIFEDILTDKEFYEESGGGVTFSGGEVLLQADGASELAKKLFENNISVIVDTAGNTDYCQFQKLNPFTTEYYFDFKAVSAEDYKKVIGGDFELIVNNIKHLLKDGKKVRARIPLIPNFNTSQQYSEKMCKVLKDIGIKYVDLLPFHRMGSAKYKALGLKYEYENCPPMSIKDAQKIEKIYQKYFQTKIEK